MPARKPCPCWPPLSCEAWGLLQVPTMDARQVQRYASLERLVLPSGAPGAVRIGRDWAVHPDALIRDKRPSGRPRAA